MQAHLTPQGQPHPPNQQQTQPQHPPPPPSGQDFQLSSVLHYLQSEWRRYEKDRNEWEIERAEMRARIALLEGERRSFEHVKLDFMRRTKMLEYALRVERAKQLSQPSGPASLKGQLSREYGGEHSIGHKAGSGTSSPRSEDMHLPQDHQQPADLLPSAPSGQLAAQPGVALRPQTWAGGPPSNVGASNPSIGKPPLGRDPKSRARSRDYLKQCLQEITYLTSSIAVNPLPNRPLLSIPASASAPNLPLALPNLPSFVHDSQPPSQHIPHHPATHPAPAVQAQQPPPNNSPSAPLISTFNGRPRKTVPDVGKDLASNTVPSSITPPILRVDEAHESLPTSEGIEAKNEDSTPSVLPPTTEQKSFDSPVTNRGIALGDASHLTAIFRPDDAGEWRKQLEAAHIKAQQAKELEENDSNFSSSVLLDDTPADQMEDNETETETETMYEDDAPGPVWKAKRTLRSHLDAVRALSFHPNELSLATGGDDCTIKIWRLDAASLAVNASRLVTDIEPQLTIRAHTASITTLIHSASKRLLYSASMDSTIRVWALPPSLHTTYAPFDPALGLAHGTLIGHTDAVWDITLVRDESFLVSCGADGSVKLWDVSGAGSEMHLKLSWGYAGIEAPVTSEQGPGATSIESIKTNLRQVAVAFSNAVVKLFDLSTGTEISKLNTDISYDGTIATQVNKIASHPTIPLLVTAHEDRYIRIFDLLTGQCTHSMLAHLDAVTSLSIDASGFSLVSGGHDCSLRFWDLLKTKGCMQESTTHRKKGEEGVLNVAFHPGGLPFVASAGADGVVKLYMSS